MKLSYRYILFFSGAVLLISLFFVYYKYIYKAPVNWEPSYSETRNDPFGTSILYQLMDELSNNKGVKKLNNPIHSYLRRQNHGAHANYVFVGDLLRLEQEDADSLFAFAEKGNDVFISAQGFPYQLSRKLYHQLIEKPDFNAGEPDVNIDTTTATVENVPTAVIENSSEELLMDSLLPQNDSTDRRESNEFNSPLDSTSIRSSEHFVLLSKQLQDSVVQFHFTHPALYSKDYTFRAMSYFMFRKGSWTYLNDSIEPKSGIERTLLGFLQPNKPVYYRYKVGKGYIYYHTLPLTLTNLYLRRNISLDYVNKVFSHLRPGVVYWDNYHRHYRYETNKGKETNPLQYFLSHAPLAWAWYLGISAVVLFFLFFGKRQQRVIPILPAKTNTSIEFAQTLARFFKRGGYRKIAEVKKTNLKMFIWEKYKISSDLPRQEYIALIAQYSGIDEVKISKVFLMLDQLTEPKNGHENELLELQKSIEYFYKNCK